MSASYFTTKDGSWFVPTDHTRGPWDVDSCHAGPPSALMIRAVEALVPHQKLTRMTVELIRPIPMTGFLVRAEIRRPGRSVTHTEAEIYDDDRVYARAYSTHIRSVDDLDVGTASTDAPAWSDSVAGAFPVVGVLHDEVSFGSSVECRYDKGSQIAVGGPTTMWMRTMYSILPDENPSPFQKIAPLADCGNGISYNGPLGPTSCVNADLTMSLHREPLGDWFASRSVSHWQRTGIGLADSELFDVEGPVGRATQSLILNRAQ
ncbi:MAG: thioesterase family protein [Acidimicrobiia bacterium]|nr:MAG: thioesterase family protein [Acidimicrobiia bacterium]